MHGDAWNLTFVQRRGDTRPIEHLIRALLKHAGRYLGLRCVADIPLRRHEFERCCRLLCEDCARIVPVKLDDNGVWWHPNKGTKCDARALRRADATDIANRRAMDARSRDDAQNVQPMPPAVERGGHD